MNIHKQVSIPEIPSPQIDAAICDLVIAITEFSDNFFDSSWANLREAEIEVLVVRLIRTLTEALEGQVLQAYLQEIRQEDNPFNF